MEVGIIALILIMAFFLVALYCLLMAGSISDEEMTTTWDEVPEENNSEKKDKQLRVDAWVIVLSIMLFSAGLVVGTVISANHLTVEATPETEAIIESTESTTAPDVDILPETEETIHIEETQAATEPIPEPTVAPEPTSEAPSAPVPEETTPAVDPDELEMLACVIYQEAGGNGSCDDCRRYVADIVLNRIAHEEFPDTMYEVLTAKGQYGRLHWTGIKWPERAKYDVEKEAVARAYRIAEEVLSGQHSKLYGNGYIWQAGFEQGSDGFWCCGHFYGR